MMNSNQSSFFSLLLNCLFLVCLINFFMSSIGLGTLNLNGARVWRVGRGREPWERSEAGGVNDNEQHLHHSPVSSPTEELRKG